MSTPFLSPPAASRARQIARLHALTQSLREYAQGLSPAGVAQREGR